MVFSPWGTSSSKSNLVGWCSCSGMGMVSVKLNKLIKGSLFFWNPLRQSLCVSVLNFSTNKNLRLDCDFHHIKCPKTSHQILTKHLKIDLSRLLVALLCAGEMLSVGGNLTTTKEEKINNKPTGEKGLFFYKNVIFLWLARLK